MTTKRNILGLKQLSGGLPTEPAISACVTTRSGCPVVLYGYFVRQVRPYVGMFYYNDSWVGCSWSKSGAYIGDELCDMDLMVVKMPSGAGEQHAQE